MMGMLNVERALQSGREELRNRFVKAETALFRARYGDCITEELKEFLESMEFDWSEVCQGLSRRMDH